MVMVMVMASKKPRNLGTKEFSKNNHSKINVKLFNFGQLFL